MRAVDVAQANGLRELLAESPWLRESESFSRDLRRAARVPRGLLLAGTPDDEPWHLAAHLSEQAQWFNLPELHPTLLRWTFPPGAPAHLAVGMDRLRELHRGETVLVVSPTAAPATLLERIADARRRGGTVFALDTGDAELRGIADETLTVPEDRGLVTFDGAQHLVSLQAAGENGRRSRGWQRRLSKMLDMLGSPENAGS